MQTFELTDTLSNFQRDPASHLVRLRKTGMPEVLTVDGEAEVVVQDAQAYQALLDRLDELESVAAIKEGISTALAGQGRPVGEFLSEMRAKYRVKRDGEDG